MPVSLVERAGCAGTSCAPAGIKGAAMGAGTCSSASAGRSRWTVGAPPQVHHAAGRRLQRLCTARRQRPPDASQQSAGEPSAELRMCHHHERSIASTAAFFKPSAEPDNRASAMQAPLMPFPPRPSAYSPGW
jgi:hypothetical protein